VDWSIEMASRYTDVDLMIFRRWDEVKALREAFDDLLDRMHDAVEGTLQKVEVVATERGLASDLNAKRPSTWFWKHEWENRKKEPGIYFELFDFAPTEYGKDIEEYPSMWLMTDGFSKLKMREDSEDFGRAVRAALSPELLTKWSHEDADLSDSPLGRECQKISESDRVHLVAGPEALGKFIIERMDEFMELVPAIEQALQSMTRR
jgi:hypothetical protein